MTSNITTNNIDNDTAIEYLEFLEQKTPSTSVDSTKGSWELVTTYFGNEPNFDGEHSIWKQGP